MGKDRNPNRHKHGSSSSGYLLNLGVSIKRSCIKEIIFRQKKKNMAQFLYGHWTSGDIAPILAENRFVFLLVEAPTFKIKWVPVNELR